MRCQLGCPYFSNLSLSLCSFGLDKCIFFSRAIHFFLHQLTHLEVNQFCNINFYFYLSYKTILRNEKGRKTSLNDNENLTCVMELSWKSHGI